MTGRIGSSLARRLASPVVIGDVSVHDLTFAESVSVITGAAAAGTGGYVCTPNAHYVVQARRHAEFRSALEGATLRVPDGMWIIYASRIAGRPLRQTVTGRLLVPAIAEIARDRSLPIAILGAADGIAARAADSLQRSFPGLAVVAALTPPMAFDIGSPVDRELAEQLKGAAPSIVFVALGAPLGARWMQAHSRELRGTVFIEVGAGIDLLAGRFRVAPGWMTRIGAEWLFRLVQEPRRLARRYLIEDPWIILWALRTRLGDR